MKQGYLKTTVLLTVFFFSTVSKLPLRFVTVTGKTTFFYRFLNRIQFIVTLG